MIENNLLIVENNLTFAKQYKYLKANICQV